ncbi:hypothetical protein V498_02018 [Pseudogymnoascus sp. VKM F-4517 (FW-2822)]|nr:hypothetical protein V498_02018 [Pseudogymnoascus sp. VKM F-4517 (FW-2822)]
MPLTTLLLQVEIIEAELVVTENVAEGSALQVNGPVGMEDYAVFRKTTISKNKAKDNVIQLNFPISKDTFSKTTESRDDMGQKKGTR